MTKLFCSLADILFLKSYFSNEAPSQTSCITIYHFTTNTTLKCHQQTHSSHKANWIKFLEETEVAFKNVRIHNQHTLQTLTTNTHEHHSASRQTPHSKKHKASMQTNLY